MIKVNLLPPEYRKVDGTPVARFVALLSGVFLTATAMSVWGYVHWGMLAEVRDRRENLGTDLVQLQALADRSQALAREFKEYQKRRDTIEQIGEDRILWSKKLDELADIIHNGGDTTRHQVWLRNVKTQGQGGNNAKLTFSGWSAGAEWKRLSDFHKDLKQTKEFFDDFRRIDAPAGKRKDFADGRVPSAAVEFSFGLELKVKGKQKGKK